ncbi:MAG TPA: cytochrome ubiquinol oxidase subunit I [Verrucomicrobiae bacterium]|jgi:cytochrome d ubiquinol oxidase subunit I|nr:cytochrome ubiquinol oxidase subunit I [Verrucomicrobiae bacterium]
MDVLTLSRIQFGLTIGFHYIYPPLSIGLGVMLVLFEAFWLKTKNQVYHQMAKFWTNIFALTFALGVATGLVMEFEFGTNWASYSRFVGDIFGSALAAEGIFAFFLEAGFLAVLLFGWDKVSPRMHFFATCMVCLGAHFSAVWITVANSFMQTPAGYHLVGTDMHRRAEVTNFWQMVMSPSSGDRLFHTLCGAWMAGAFLVISVSAYYLLKKRHEDFAWRCMQIALPVALLASIVQGISGDMSARMVAKWQPAKLAAFEGLYHTETNAPLAIVGYVDEKDHKVEGLEVPELLSFLTYHDLHAQVQGLDSVPPEDWPPVQACFMFFHGMVAIGVALLAVSMVGCLVMWRGELSVNRWLLWILVFSVLGPAIANQLGWFAAEVGRQPWIVWHEMRTPAGLSAVIRANTVLTSLVLFTFIYMLLFAVFIYMLNHKIQTGPHPDDLVPHGKLAIPNLTTDESTS